MFFQIYTKGIKLSAVQEEYLREKFVRLEELTRKSRQEPVMNVFISTTRHQQKEEMIRLAVSLRFLKHEIFSKEEGYDLYALIDILQEKLARQIKREKEKPFARLKQGALRLKEWLRTGFGKN